MDARHANEMELKYNHLLSPGKRAQIKTNRNSIFNIKQFDKAKNQSDNFPHISEIDHVVLNTIVRGKQQTPFLLIFLERRRWLYTDYFSGYCSKSKIFGRGGLAKGGGGGGGGGWAFYCMCESHNLARELKIKVKKEKQWLKQMHFTVWHPSLTMLNSTRLEL